MRRTGPACATAAPSGTAAAGRPAARHENRLPAGTAPVSESQAGMPSSERKPVAQTGAAAPETWCAGPSQTYGRDSGQRRTGRRYPTAGRELPRRLRQPRPADQLPQRAQTSQAASPHHEGQGDQDAPRNEQADRGRTQRLSQPCTRGAHRSSCYPRVWGRRAAGSPIAETGALLQHPNMLVLHLLRSRRRAAALRRDPVTSP
jgi:hypothetical protein